MKLTANSYFHFLDKWLSLICVSEQACSLVLCECLHKCFCYTHRQPDASTSFMAHATTHNWKDKPEGVEATIFTAVNLCDNYKN